MALVVRPCNPFCLFPSCFSLRNIRADTGETGFTGVEGSVSGLSVDLRFLTPCVVFQIELAFDGRLQETRTLRYGW